LGKIIDQEKLEIDDQELEIGLKEMSENFNQPLEGIKQYYDQNKEKLDLFKHTLLEKKAITLILESSKLEDVQPETETKSKSKK
jgi:trigger factor